MILGVALFLTASIGNPVIELPEPAAGFVSVQAIVRLPVMNGHELAQLRVMAEAMDDEVDVYSRSEMLDIAAMAGDTLRITVQPDHLRIQIGVPPENLKHAIGYVDQILHGSRLSDDSLNRAIAELIKRKRPLWAAAIDPVRYRYDRLRRQDILDLYGRLCRPENTWLSVGGAFTPGDAESVWREKLEAWHVERPPRPSLDREPPAALLSVSGGLSTIELTGPPISGKDPALPTKLLALIALGSGKGSSMFARLREAKGWSYRQEAILTPTVEGFLPRLLMASNDPTPPFELAAGMKSQLDEAVSLWVDADLARAKGMARGIFERGIEMSPLYFNPSWPVGGSLHDRTFMAAYWFLKTGRNWDPAGLLEQMEFVSLADLKAAAIALLEDTKPRVLIGAAP